MTDGRLGEMLAMFTLYKSWELNEEEWVLLLELPLLSLGQRLVDQRHEAEYPGNSVCEVLVILQRYRGDDIVLHPFYLTLGVE